MMPTYVTAENTVQLDHPPDTEVRKLESPHLCLVCERIPAVLLVNYEGHGAPVCRDHFPGFLRALRGEDDPLENCSCYKCRGGSS